MTRISVYPQIASAVSPSSNLFATLDSTASIPGREPSTARGRGGISLNEAIAIAVVSHPLMGAQAAKVTGSLADVRVAEGATRPQLSVYGGSGGSMLGGYSNTPILFGTPNIPASARTDAGATFRQLVYDFGAARADIERTRSLVSAERLRLADQAEDIALRTANVYMDLLEQRELISLIDEMIADQKNLANLVRLSERNGNGTVADVDRVKSKEIEAETLRTDILTSYQGALDEFFRLTKRDPGQVRRPTALPQIPRSLDVALDMARHNNPALLALKATGGSIDFQLESQKAQGLPRVDIQGDALAKHYTGNAAASQGIVDSRLMLMVSYKLLDGGVLAAVTDRIREDQRANDFKILDQKESIVLNFRRFFQALSANRTKEIAATQGVKTARNANSLYIEQFKAGKRTVFEVLDSRMVVFTMERSRLSASYEQLRAAYGILRNTGRLVETIVRS